MAQVGPLICATFSPGTVRNASGIEVAPERAMSSDDTTRTAAAASANGSARLSTLTIFTCASCARSSCASSSGVIPVAPDAIKVPAKTRHVATQVIAMALLSRFTFMEFLPFSSGSKPDDFSHRADNG